MAREYCEYCGQLSRVSDPMFCWNCGKKFGRGGGGGAADNPHREERSCSSSSSGSKSNARNSSSTDSDGQKSLNHEIQIPEYNDIYNPPGLQHRIPSKKYGKRLLQEDWNFQYRIHMINKEMVKKWLTDSKIEPGAPNTNFVVSPSLKKKILKIIHQRYKRLTRLEFDGKKMKYWQPEDIYRVVHEWLKSQRKNKKGKVFSSSTEEGSKKPVGEGGSNNCESGNGYEGGDTGNVAEAVEEAEGSTRRNRTRKKQSRKQKTVDTQGEEHLDETAVLDEILVQGEMNAPTVADMYQRLSRHMLSLVNAEGDAIFPRALMRNQSASEKLKLFATWLRNRGRKNYKK